MNDVFLFHLCFVFLFWNIVQTEFTWLTGSLQQGLSPRQPRQAATPIFTSLIFFVQFQNQSFWVFEILTSNIHNDFILKKQSIPSQQNASL